MGPPVGWWGVGYGGQSGFEVIGGGVTPRRTTHTQTTDGGNGIGARANLIYRAHFVGLLPWGSWLRATPQLISVLTETAHQIGGRGCL